MQRLLLALLLCPLTIAAQSTLNDLNGDGCVGTADILIILGEYGECNDTTVAFACGDSVLFDNYWYETVPIGGQCWFAENLRSEMYGNGDAIPAGLSDGEWSSTTSGAVTVYGEGANCVDNSPDIDACDPIQSLNEYGRLYNWYAVDDERGLCPSGWHVPTDEEWMSLEINLGMGDVEANNTGWRGTDQGSQLKTDFGWYNGGNGVNTSGMSGLPGGIRGSNGSFFVAGSYGYWWSSSPQGTFAWFRNLYTSNATVYRNSNFNRRGGFSVRCVRDAE